MISSMASIPSSSSATVRVEKATSEFLIGPDWTLNIDICDTINSNQMLAKDVVKAVKKRLQHKNPKVQLLALTLLETMVKNCGDYVHFQIAERNILQEMAKIVRKKTDMHVRDKILTLIGSWYEAFGGNGGRYPQYYMAYEDLRRSGVVFPQRPPDSAPIFTPPVAHPISRQPQQGYGMPSSSSTRLDEAMAADDNLSLSSINSMRDVLELLTEMLKAVDPSDRSAIKDEVILDLVEQCRANQRKLMQMLGTTGDEELLGQGLELNDTLQSVLAKNDAIASGSPLPPELTNITPEKHNNSTPKAADVSMANATSSSDTPSTPVLTANRGLIDEEDEEEDDFAQLARRHSKTRADVSRDTLSDDVAPSEAPSMSQALVPVNTPSPVRTKDQDIIDLLSITLSTATSTEQTPHAHFPSTSHGPTFPSEAYSGNLDNNYIAPWAQPQPQPQPKPTFQSQPEHSPYTHFQPQAQPLYNSQPVVSPPQQIQSQPQNQARYQYATQQQLHPPQPQIPQYTTSSYPPPPWAATPGYFSNPSPVTKPSYAYSGPTSSYNTRPMQHEPINGEAHSSSSPRSAGPNVGPKPFIPSYRLFEDLNVFGNTDGRFKATSGASSLSGSSNNQNLVGGRK